MSCDTSSGGYFVCENVSSLTNGYQQVLCIVQLRATPRTASDSGCTSGSLRHSIREPPGLRKSFRARIAHGYYGEGNTDQRLRKTAPVRVKGERRATHPTIVTPIGQGALPIERRRYASLARWY